MNASMIEAARPLLLQLLPEDERATAPVTDMLLHLYIGEINRLTDPIRVMHLIESFLAELVEADDSTYRRRMQLVEHCHTLNAMTDADSSLESVKHAGSKTQQLEIFFRGREYPEDLDKQIFTWSKRTLSMLTGVRKPNHGFWLFATVIVDAATMLRHLESFDAETQRAMFNILSYDEQAAAYHRELFMMLSDFIITDDAVGSPVGGN